MGQNTKVSCYGFSNGQRMTWDQHLENYPNKEELTQWNRIHQINQMGNLIRCSLLIKEFGSFEKAILLQEELSIKIFEGWDPTD